MKFKLILIITFFSVNLMAQNWNLSELDLQAHFELSQDGLDSEENHPAISLDTPIFNFDGVLSRGCYVNNTGFGDSCLIRTPQIESLNDLVYAIQLDFNVTEFRAPIFIAGRSHRYLGAHTTSNGELVLLTNNSNLDTIPNLNIELNEWYNITIVHNTLDSNTYLYLGEDLLLTKKDELNQPETDNTIMNSNFAWGRAFHGYWKNLKIYSTNNELLSNKELESNNIKVKMYPNPAITTLSLEIDNSINLNYSIINSQGQLIEKSKLANKKIDIQNLNSGMFWLLLLDKEEVIWRSRFIKIQ